MEIFSLWISILICMVSVAIPENANTQADWSSHSYNYVDDSNGLQLQESDPSMWIYPNEYTENILAPEEHNLLHVGSPPRHLQAWRSNSTITTRGAGATENAVTYSTGSRFSQPTSGYTTGGSSTFSSNSYTPTQLTYSSSGSTTGTPILYSSGSSSSPNAVYSDVSWNPRLSSSTGTRYTGSSGTTFTGSSSGIPYTGGTTFTSSSGSPFIGTTRTVSGGSNTFSGGSAIPFTDYVPSSDSHMSVGSSWSTPVVSGSGRSSHARTGTTTGSDRGASRTTGTTYNSNGISGISYSGVNMTQSGSSSSSSYAIPTFTGGASGGTTFTGSNATIFTGSTGTPYSGTSGMAFSGGSESMGASYSGRSTGIPYTGTSGSTGATVFSGGSTPSTGRGTALNNTNAIRNDGTYGSSVNGASYTSGSPTFSAGGRAPQASGTNQRPISPSSATGRTGTSGTFSGIPERSRTAASTRITSPPASDSSSSNTTASSTATTLPADPLEMTESPHRDTNRGRGSSSFRSSGGGAVTSPVAQEGSGQPTYFLREADGSLTPIEPPPFDQMKPDSYYTDLYLTDKPIRFENQKGKEEQFKSDLGKAHARHAEAIRLQPQEGVMNLPITDEKRGVM